MGLKPRAIMIMATLLILLIPAADSAFSAEGEKSLFVLHVSSYKNQKEAETEISGFLKKDLQAFYRYETVEGKGNWYRVFIGTFETRQEAQSKAVELMSAGIITYAAPREITPDFVPWLKAAAVETKPEKPASPPISPPVVTEVPPPAAVTQQPAAAPVAKTVEEPPAPKTEAAPVPEKKAAAESEKKIAEPVQPVTETPKETKEEVEPALKKISTLETSSFSLAMSAGVSISSNAKDFKITEETASFIRTRYFNGDAFQVSLEPSLRAYGPLSLYGRVDYVFVTDVNILYASFGPKLSADPSSLVIPYIKGGVVWGDLNFDIVPGKFESAYGYEVGVGFEILKTPLKIGGNLLYRDIEFEYIDPGIEGVTASDVAMDASGVSVTGTLSYHF